MKNYLVCVVVALGFIFAIGCSSEKPVENADSAKQVCAPKSVNPNGDSELALLMREMANWTDSCKVAIELGNVVPAKPTNLQHLHSAKKTDETIDMSLYNSMASLYQGRVADFEGAIASNRTELFNSMVSGCVGCHQNFCGGPLVRINKMFIAAK